MTRFRHIFAMILSLLAQPALSGEVPLGDDGLHKPDWLLNSFKVLPEDHQEAAANDRLLLLIVEQRGCIYCAQLHNEVLTDPRIDRMIREQFDVVQVDLFGATELTDMDGEVLTEKRATAKWGVTVTPSLLLLAREPAAGTDAARAAMAVLPGVLEADRLLDVLEWAQAGGPQTGRSIRNVLAQ